MDTLLLDLLNNLNEFCTVLYDNDTALPDNVLSRFQEVCVVVR